MKFMMNFVFREVRYTVEKEDSDAYQYFLLFSSVVQSLHFQQCWPKSSFSAVLSKVFIFSSVVQSLHFQQCCPKSSFSAVLSKVFICIFNSSLHIYSFSHFEEKKTRKTLWNNAKLLQDEQFHLFCNIFYVICI